MINKIGTIIFQVIAVLAFVAGVLSLFEATGIPGSYRMYSASAVQITQVYSEATFVMLRAIGYFLMAIFIQVALNFDPSRDSRANALKKDTEAIKSMLGKIGNLLQRMGR